MSSAAERFSRTAPVGTVRPLGNVGLGASLPEPYRLTEKRRAWLLKLRDEGPAFRPRNNIGYCCMQAGWTEWYAEFKDGREMPMSEARKLYPGPEAWDMFKSGQFRECITDKGRAILAPSPTIEE
jgi:hypothetical protein